MGGGKGKEQGGRGNSGGGRVGVGDPSPTGICKPHNLERREFSFFFKDLLIVHHLEVYTQRVAVTHDPL